MTFRRLIPFLRGFAAAAVFLGSAALPILHEWKVGTAEAEFHAAVAEPGQPTVLPGRSGHKHHSDSDCALCPLLLRTGAADSSSAASSAPAGPGTLLGPIVVNPSSFDASLLPPSRAPPAA